MSFSVKKRVAVAVIGGVLFCAFLAVVAGYRFRAVKGVLFNEQEERALAGNWSDRGRS